jgi:hypothetical protein
MTIEDVIDALQRRQGEIQNALNEAIDGIERIQRLVNRTTDPLLNLLVEKLEAKEGLSQPPTLSLRDHKILAMGKKLEQLAEQLRVQSGIADALREREAQRDLRS